jgi:hypothetical protein
MVFSYLIRTDRAIDSLAVLRVTSGGVRVSYRKVRIKAVKRGTTRINERAGDIENQTP